MKFFLSVFISVLILGCSSENKDNSELENRIDKIERSINKINKNYLVGKEKNNYTLVQGKPYFWSLIISLLSPLATFTAVYCSLYLASKSDRINVVIDFKKNDDGLDIILTNCNRRDVVLVDVMIYLDRFQKKPIFYLEKYPSWNGIKLSDGDICAMKSDIFYRLDEENKKSPKYLWDRLKRCFLKSRIVVTTSTGNIFVKKIPSNIFDRKKN